MCFNFEAKRHIAFLVFSLSVSVNAQSLVGIDSNYFKVRILKLNLLSPVAQALGLGYEISTSQSSSLQINGLFAGGGFLITSEYRYYLSETPAPKGTFIAPFGNYGKVDTQDIYGGGIVIGYQGFFKKKITVDAFFGPSYQVGLFDRSGFFVRGGLFLGVNLRKPPNK